MKNVKLSTKELILEEANAFGLRNDVITVAEGIKTTLASVGLDSDFTEVQIYQEAFETCINVPEYFEYYKHYFKS